MANGVVNIDIIVAKESSLGNILDRIEAERHVETLEEYELRDLKRTIKSANHNHIVHDEYIVAYAMLTSKELGLSEQESRLISYATQWHDVGKLWIPSSILDKPSKLNDYEWNIIKKHPLYSEQRINPFTYISKIARHHHERYDGTGYPDGLKNGKIPIGARIVAVTDAFCAMTHDRGYNHDRVLNSEQAVYELRRCSGTQFDSEVVEAFVKALKFFDRIDKNI